MHEVYIGVWDPAPLLSAIHGLAVAHPTGSIVGLIAASAVAFCLLRFDAEQKAANRAAAQR